MKARLVRIAPLALVVACFFVTGLVSVALAGPGTGSSGPGGGCPVATFSSPGCVKLSQIPGSDGGTSSFGPLTLTSQSILTCAATDCTADTNPGLYFPTTAASQYDAIKIGGDVGNPNSNWGFTLGILSSGPYFRSRASGLGMDLANNGALFPASANANDLGTSSNTWRSIYIATNYAGGTPTRGTCTLNGATPAICTATVTAGSICTCSIVGATAAIAAKGCAVGISGTTLTITSAAAAGENVNYHCFL